MEFSPVLVTLGGVEIRWYSVLILVAAFLVYAVASAETKRFKISKDFMFNMFFWTLIFGIVGARLYYCVFNWEMYKANPVEILKVWNGGLAIHGGLAFGLITILMYCKKYRVKPLRIIDCCCVPLLLGQAIGRWGNFFNQEAHGAATTAEILKRLFVPDFIIEGMTIDGVVYMPTFLFESILCLIAFIVLLFVRRSKYIKVGTMTSSYLMIYGGIRFFIEMSRTDALMLGGFKVAQIVSVGMFIVGLLMMMFLSRKGKFEDLYNDATNITEIKF